MIVIACPDQGAGNDPEALGFSLLPPRSYIHYAHCQAAANLVNQDGEFWPSAAKAGSSSHYQPDFDELGSRYFTRDKRIIVGHVTTRSYDMYSV